MKIIEVISKFKEMPVGTIIRCKETKGKYKLVKDSTGKNKHFSRIKDGKSTPKFQGLIYSDCNFEIVKYCNNCGCELTDKEYSDTMCWECKCGICAEKILEDKIDEIEELSKITKEEFERLDKRTLLELIVKNQNKIIDKLNKQIDTSKDENCMSD